MTVLSQVEVLYKLKNRDMRIELDHLSRFGFELRGVPSFPPKYHKYEFNVSKEADSNS